jgi:hypothetical protein
MPGVPLLLRGATVRTMDPRRPVARALLIEGDRVTAVLDDTHAPDGTGTGERDAPAGAERLDLGGACLLPGFTDAHVHGPSWALARAELSLVDATSLADALARVRAARRPGAWLRGRGWRAERWPPGDVPTRAALDAACGDARVALRAHDGHSLWLSSAALAAAGGDLEVQGGVVERDARGEPTGVLREEAAWRFEARHLRADRAEALAALRAALPAAAAEGVVAVHDKDGHRGAPELYAALAERGELTLRVWQSRPVERLDEIPAGGGYVKAFLDGTLGSRTARLLDGSGVEIMSAGALADLVRRAAARRVAVAVHAIGDRANRDALDAFEASAPAWRPLGLRPRIEHAQCVHPADVPRFARLGVTASVQYTHATSDRDLAERLWADRIARAYPYRSLHAAGARLAGGSDAPVEPLSPLAGVRAAVARTADDRPAWHPEQALEVDAALESFTSVPAWLEHAEARRGRLRPGLLADLVVLDRDPHTDLHGARVVATMLGGSWVHGPFVP